MSVPAPDPPRLAHAAGDESRRGDSLAREFRGQPQGRLAERLVGQAEGAPMHGDGLAAAGFLKDGHRFLRVEVHRLHEPARRVGTGRT